MIKYIPLDLVRPGMIALNDVLSPRENVPVVVKNTVLTSQMIKAFKRHGISAVAVDSKTAIRFNEPPPEVKPVLNEILREAAVSGIRKLFLTARDGADNYTTAYQAVKELDSVVDELVDTLSTEESALVHISDLKSYDEYTYHHSLSVAVLCIAIGLSLRMSDKEIRTLGRCGIMHDIGKMYIPLEIINKPSSLSEDEFAEIKRHPKDGYDFLVRGNICNEEVRQAVLGHHEKINGSGYPLSVGGSLVPFSARVVAVADVYDAVTSYRPYRSPLSPSEAIEMVMGEIGVSFEYDIVKAFVDKLEPYPVNTFLQLSDSRSGVVIDCANTMRPVLQMTEDGEIIDLADKRNLSLVITSVLNM